MCSSTVNKHLINKIRHRRTHISGNLGLGNGICIWTGLTDKVYFDSTTSSAGVPTSKAREIAVMLSKPLLFAMLTLVGYIIISI